MSSEGEGRYVADPGAWGIEPGYHDVGGEWHQAPDDTVATFLECMGADVEHAEEPPGLGHDNPVWVVPAGEQVRADGRWQVRTEGGATLEIQDWVPSLPLGYHHLTRLDDGREVRLIVSPGRCHLPEGLRTWGWAVQLYGLLSSSSAGIGDLRDLRTLAQWASGQGAGMMLVNPLHASLPGLPQERSPYFPSSRCYRSPLYLRVDGVQGWSGEEGGRVTRIDRDAVWDIKLPVLEKEFESFGGSPSFDRYRAEQGATLERYATFCALAEVHGRPWQEWPADVRSPRASGVAEFATDPDTARRVEFHAWLQWKLDEQLAAAGSDIPLVHDLAIGVDPAGADAWQWQDVFALGVSVGAPPDEFNTAGQDWALPPLDPWRLRAARYEPFIQTVRAGLRHAGGLRVDHVMGLFRLYWIPEGGTPDDGTYVRYPWTELLDILALESVRAAAYVVGEDLGTVEPWVREELTSRNVLSTRLLWFEETPPREYPAQALAAVTTHDLPTIAGAWTRADPGEGVETMRARLAGYIGVPDDTPVDDVVLASYALLSEAPSAVVTATLEDAVGVVSRPNMPATTLETNWSVPLPVTLEELMVDPRAEAIAETLKLR
jgi:4-alpha-glucanotransferase